MIEAQFEKAIGSVREAMPDQRFAIYRNNVASALVNALAVRYPVTEQLVGQEFFRAMAALFAEDHKPKSAILIHYGEQFPDFVANFEPARVVPYLPDVAQLETLWWRAYHAADSSAVSGSCLSAVAPDELGNIRMSFHPSVAIQPAPFAIAKIWHAHHGGAAMGTFDIDGASHVMVYRDGVDVYLRELPAASAAFTSALLGGETLLDAVSTASELTDSFDLAAHLAEIFQLNIILGISK